MVSNHEQVIRAIEDRFYEEGKLSDKTDLHEATGISRNKLSSTLDDLEGTGIVAIYDKEHVATVFATQRMVNSLSGQAGEPDWIEVHEFEEKRELAEGIRDANEKIADFRKIERLLFGSGDPLEDSVEYALTELGFEVTSTESEEDHIIEQDDDIYVLEVKGVSEIIHKKHITQLAGWLDMKIDEGISSDNLIGMLVHNTERHEPPDERGEPLTNTAKEFLRLRQSRHISTKKLFGLVKSVRNEEMSAEDARTEFLEGEPYE